MTMTKNLLLGSVAAAFVLGGSAALAADQPRAPQRTPVWACDITGFWELPGTDICFKVGGYAKFDMNIHFDEFDSGAGLPNGGGAEEAFGTFGIGGIVDRARLAPGVAFVGTGDEFRITARQSRINFDARTNTSYGTVRAFIEGDFYGSGGNELISNSAGLRLRHAFVQFGNLLAGQTWGTFMDLPALHDTLDFGGPGAASFTRSAQIRWTQPLGNGLSLLVALENPENMDRTALAGVTSDELPDFVAKLVVNQEWGHVELGAVLRDMQGGAAVATALGLAGATAEDGIGWAVSLSGRINVPVANGRDDIRFTALYSDGGTRHLLGAAAIGFANAAGTEESSAEWNDSGQLIKSWAVSASYRHFWSDNLRSSLVGSFVKIDNVTSLSSVEDMTEIVANLIWSPVARVDMGVELYYMSADLLGGTIAGTQVGDTDMLKLQFSISRSF